MILDLYPIVISYIALFSVVLTFDAVLMFHRKGVLRQKIRSVAAFAMLECVTASVIAFFYIKQTAGLSIIREYPRQWFLIHDTLLNFYSIFLVLAPIFSILFFLYTKKDSRKSFALGLCAVACELSVLISTVLI
jgi:hypothetical protein